jgi:MSHA biogenesis protein MshP
MSHPLIRSRGFAIVSAIFILVVLAVLGAAMVTISTSQQIGSAQDLQSTRAYQAARAGIDWGLYQITRDGVADDGSNFAALTAVPAPASNPLTWCAGTAAAPTRSSFSLATAAAAATTLAAFTVTVECYATADSYGGPWVIRLRSTACNQPGSVEPLCPNTSNPATFYIERRLTITL